MPKEVGSSRKKHVKPFKSQTIMRGLELMELNFENGFDFGILIAQISIDVIFDDRKIECVTWKKIMEIYIYIFFNQMLPIYVF